MISSWFALLDGDGIGSKPLRYRTTSSNAAVLSPGRYRSSSPALRVGAAGTSVLLSASFGTRFSMMPLWIRTPIRNSGDGRWRRSDSCVTLTGVDVTAESFPSEVFQVGGRRSTYLRVDQRFTGCHHPQWCNAIKRTGVAPSVPSNDSHMCFSVFVRIKLKFLIITHV